MPRKHHSPSSLATAELCEKKWGYTYLAGMRSRELTWAEIEAGAPHSNGERSRALGTAVHAILEDWFLGKDPAWSTFPGQVALSGAHHLPHPTRLAAQPRVEQWVNIGCTPKLVGKVDLRVLPTEAESKRLGLSRGWVTIDYKTSKDLAWCKSVSELEGDGQLNVYALDHSKGLGVDVALMRWLYFDTGKKRQAKPVDVVRTYTDASTKVHLMLEHARHLDTLESVEACTPNPEACGAFGGCEFHKSKGGPCGAQRRLGKIIQARNPKEIQDMALGQFGMGFRKQVQAQASAAPFAPPVVEAPPPVVEAPPPVVAAPPPAPAPVVAAELPPEPPARTEPTPPPAPRAGPDRPRKTAPVVVENVTNVAAPESKGVQMTITFTGAPDELAALLEKIYA